MRNIRCTFGEKQKPIPNVSVSHNDVGKYFQVIWDVTLGRLFLVTNMPAEGFL